MEFRLLRADEIEARVATVSEKGCSILLYKDARADMILLDETVGAMNWKREHSRENANCTVSIWDDEKKQWISKEDTGTQSYTEAEKGLASDSFKRACVNWGIGRELYTSPFIWFHRGEANIIEKNGKPSTNDHFKVMEINYDGRNILNVTVMDEKTHTTRVFGGSTKTNKPKDAITAKEAKEIEKLVSESEYGSRSVLTHYNVTAFTELTKEQAKELRAKLGK